MGVVKKKQVQHKRGPEASPRTNLGTTELSPKEGGKANRPAWGRRMKAGYHKDRGARPETQSVDGSRNTGEGHLVEIHGQGRLRAN